MPEKLTRDNKEKQANPLKWLAIGFIALIGIDIFRGK